MSNAVVNVADFASKESVTAGLQEAVDALPESGGVVVIPPGEYRLRRSVLLRSRVTLRGSGAPTVLRRPPERVYRLTKRTAKNRTYVTLDRTTGLKVGDALYVRDERQGGWHSRHGIFLEGHRNNVVTGNVFIDDQDKPTQLKKIEALNPAGENLITDNH